MLDVPWSGRQQHIADLPETRRAATVVFGGADTRIQIQEPQPRNIQRVDIAPSKGNALVVDGHFKTQYNAQAAASKTASELIALFPNLRIEIYDASTKIRTLVK